MSRIIRAADLFCGAGGTSQGAEQSGAAKVVCAVNHWQIAVETHSANFPHAKHINSRIDQVNPGECPKIDLLFASPECTHHSRARGGKPTSDQQRSGAWDLMRWIEFHRPSWIVVENVPEFREWGPVGDCGRPLPKFRGRFFGTWLQAIQAAGYRVDHRLLNAADYGAATSRTRLFVVARKGNRGVHWPDPSHGERVGGELPGMGGQKRWRCAAEIIDWSIPCQSVFLRSRPLKDNTLLRIEAGLRRFIGPFVVPRNGFYEHNTLKRCRGIDEPLNTITASHVPAGVALPFTFSSLSDGAARGVGRPTPTQTATGGVHLTVPFLSAFHNGDDGANRNYPPGVALPKRGQAIAVPFIVTYYANGKAYPVANPLCTISTRDRCGLGYAVIQTAGPIEPRTAGERKLYATMQELGVADVGFRMLVNPELSLAQGFPAEYIFAGNKGEVTKQIGNAVCPDVAAAITRAIAV